MKILISVYSCVLALGIGSCKKSEQPPVSTEIFGEWQWISSVGGFTGKDILTPAIAGVERTYLFNRDSTFVDCLDKQCATPVKFTLRMETSFFDNQQHLILTIPRRIYLAPPDTGFHIIRSRYTVQEVSNSLRLAQERPDGYEESYSRK